MSKDQIKAAYEQYTLLQASIKEMKAALGSLEKERDVHEAVLLKGIKPNESKSGVFHKQTVTKSVKYAQVLAQARERFIPKTKQQELDVLIENFTTVSTRDSFELEG